MYERVVRKPILRLGKFSARTGPFEVTSKRLSDCIFGINSRFAQETPVKLKFLHGHGLQAVATNVGYMNRAAEEYSGVASSDLHITEDLKADLGDGLAGDLHGGDSGPWCTARVAKGFRSKRKAS